MEIQLWRSILCPYELAVRELEVKFNHIIDECKENDVYCPIEQVEGRVKSVSCFFVFLLFLFFFFLLCMFLFFFFIFFINLF